MPSQKSFIKPIMDKAMHTKVRTVLILCVVCVISAFTINLVSDQYYRNYRSDDVANQYVVQSLVKNHGGHGVFPEDSFVIHFPLYLLTDLVIHDNSRVKLFLQAYLLGLTFLVCTVVVLTYYLKKTRLYGKTSILIGGLVLAFVFSTPTFAEYMMEINQRPLETGIMLLLLLPAHMFLSTKAAHATWKSVLYGVGYALATGMLWYDDPYFMYIMAGGTVFTVAIMWISKKISWQKLAVVTAVLLSSAILVKLYGLLFRKLGIFLVPNPSGNTTLINPDSIVTNLQNTLATIFLNFNAGLFGLNPLTTEKKLLVPLLCGAILAIFAIAALIRSAKTYFKNAFVLRTLLSTIAISLLLVYFLTRTGSIITERYFIALPILLLPLITEFVVCISRATYYRAGQLFIAVVAAGLLVMVAANAHGAALGITHKRRTVHNDVNYAIIKAVERAGYEKGYANYWQAPINSYLSQDRILFLPSLCTPNGKVTPYHWLTNDDGFHQPASRTFFLYDPDIPAPATCTIPQVERQFGPPANVVHVGDKTILFYRYDITGKLHAPLPL